MVDALRSGLPAAEVEASVLPGLQEIHWAIHRAFSEHQQISEDRRLRRRPGRGRVERGGGPNR